MYKINRIYYDKTYKTAMAYFYIKLDKEINDPVETLQNSSKIHIEWN